MSYRSLRAACGRAAPAAALLAAVAATASLSYAISKYLRAAARARSESSTAGASVDCSSAQRAQPLQAAPQPSVSSDSFDTGTDFEPTRLSSNAWQRTLAVHCSSCHPSPFIRPAAAYSRPFAWTVFWDLENTHVPSSTPPAAFVQALCTALRSITPHSCVSHPHPVLRILAVANIHTTSLQQRKSLQSNGVSILHFETDGRKDACDKALITELCLLAREHAPPMGVALLSADVDFAYALSRLTALGYYTAVVAPNMPTLSRQLASVPNAVLTFDQILAHIPPRVVPQPHQNPKVKPAAVQQRADQKPPAPPNPAKPQKKRKSPKQPPLVSGANNPTRTPKSKPQLPTDQKPPAPPNPAKPQKKRKSPKQPPLVSGANNPTRTLAPNPQLNTDQKPASVPNAVLTFDQILAHIPPRVVPQPHQNPKVKPAAVQQRAAQKPPAPPNPAKPQKKRKSPKQPPLVSGANNPTRTPKSKPQLPTDQKPPAPPNPAKPQKKRKSPKQPPLVSGANNPTRTPKSKPQLPTDQKPPAPPNPAKPQKKRKSPKQPPLVSGANNPTRTPKSKPQLPTDQKPPAPPNPAKPQKKRKSPSKQPPVVSGANNPTRTLAPNPQLSTDQKPRAPRNAPKGQQKRKSPPKQPPVVSGTNFSVVNTTTELRHRKVPQPSGTDDADVTTLMQSHSINSTQSFDPHVPTDSETVFLIVLGYTALFSILFTLAVLYWAS